MASHPYVDLPGVGSDHLAGIFGDFRQTLEDRIVMRRSKGNRQNLEIARFFEYLLGEVDAEAYERVRNRFLLPDAVARDAGMIKYLDPVTWFESKLRVAWQLGLDSKPPMRILDLGTGPGHFPVVARFYGHDVTGTDLPKASMGVDETGHFYDEMCALYRVKRISQTIRPYAKTIGLGNGYDMATAFLAAFNVYGGTRPWKFERWRYLSAVVARKLSARNGGTFGEKLSAINRAFPRGRQKEPWTIDHWNFFLADLRDNVLASGGILFMTLDNKKLTDEVWSFLKSVAEQGEDRNKHILLAKFDTFE